MRTRAARTPLAGSACVSLRSVRGGGGRVVANPQPRPVRGPAGPGRYFGASFSDTPSTSMLVSRDRSRPDGHPSGSSWTCLQSSNRAWNSRVSLAMKLLRFAGGNRASQPHDTDSVSATGPAAAPLGCPGRRPHAGRDARHGAAFRVHGHHRFAESALQEVADHHPAGIVGTVEARSGHRAGGNRASRSGCSWADSMASWPRRCGALTRSSTRTLDPCGGRPVNPARLPPPGFIGSFGESGLNVDAW